ncbi:MAG: Rossmann-like domain-containing protein [Pseudomonas sp.]
MNSQSGLLAELHQEVARRLGDELDEITLQRAVVGVFFTGVILDNGVGGMCATPIKSIPEAVCCPSSAKVLPRPGKLRGRPAKQILNDLYATQDMRRALAIATLNALTETLWLRDGAPPDCSLMFGDAFQTVHYGSDDEVVLVGAFPPYMRALRKAGQSFKVLEMDPDTLKPDEMPYYVPAAKAPEIIPHADVLITTGTTLTNGTLESLLSWVKSNAEVAVIGPTAPLLVQPFAERGVTILGGTRVKAPEALLDLLAEGASGYHFFEDSVERVTLHLPRRRQD